MLSPYHSSYNGEIVNSNFGSLALTSDKTLLVVGGSTDCDSGFGTNRGRIVVYNVEDFSVKGQIIRGDTDGQLIGFSVEISDDGTRVFTACGDQKSRVYLYNSLTDLWELEYTTPTIPTPLTAYGLSIRCDALGTTFFVTGGHNSGVSDRKIYFYSNNGLSWSPNASRTTLVPSGVASWIADTDSIMSTLIGVYNTFQSFTAYTWTGSSWVAKGSNFGSFLFQASGMSSDGNTVALFDSGNNLMKVYDWSGSAWIIRPTIALDSGSLINSKIYISTDKNTISFTGTPDTSTVFGVWTYNGSSWAQDRSYYNDIVTNISATSVLSQRSQVLSGDKEINVAAYRNGDNNFNGIMVYKPGPLVDPVDDDYDAQPFNVHPNNQRLIPSPPYNVLVNDDFTSPQPLGDGIVASNDINSNAVLNSNGDFYITANHPSGEFSFTYTVTDVNGRESDPATASYTVYNYGITGSLTVEDITAGQLTEILTSDEIYNLIADSDDLNNISVTVSLYSGDSPPRTFDVTDQLNYEVIVANPGPQNVIVTFTYNGEILDVGANFNVLPNPNPPGQNTTYAPLVLTDPTVVHPAAPVAPVPATGISATTTVIIIASILALLVLFFLIL